MPHLSHLAASQPDKPAYILAKTGEAVTYSELEARSNQAAHLFRALGLLPQDHIAFLMENHRAFFEIVWGAQRSGLYYTAIASHLTPGEIGYIVTDCGARLFITSAKFKEQAGALKALLPPGTHCFMVDGVAEGFASWEEAVSRQPATPLGTEISGYDMLYSSGTTGRPKGVMRPFAGEAFGTPNPFMDLLCKAMAGMSGDTVYVSPAPLYHAAPLRWNLSVMAYGGTSIIMERFDPEEFLALIARHKATHTQVVPTMFIRMLKLPPDVRARYDVTTLRCAIHAAAPCPAAVKDQMMEWWGPVLLEYYAGTEGNGLTIINSKDAMERRGSVGRAIIGELKILDEAGEELPPGEIGTIYFAGGPQFAYHNDTAKTQGAYAREGVSTLGDVGYRDEEGFLYLTDRKAYMIISGGVNIYPQEAEDVLVGHPKVTDVAVFGIPHEELGEEVKAVVQPADMADAGPALAAELMAYCRQHLSPVKCPRTVDFMAELPRSQTGKLYKRILRDEYWQGRKPAAA